jgi:hypothetical protein
MNQCDGCRAGIPVDKNGNHRMGKPGSYANLQACQKSKYETPPPEEKENHVMDKRKELKKFLGTLESRIEKSLDSQIEPTNAMRAEWASIGLDTFSNVVGVQDEDFDTQVSDFLADLWHLCNKKDVDLEKILRNARLTVIDEILEEQARS